MSESKEDQQGEVEKAARCKAGALSQRARPKEGGSVHRGRPGQGAVRTGWWAHRARLAGQRARERQGKPAQAHRHRGKEQPGGTGMGAPAVRLRAHHQRARGRLRQRARPGDQWQGPGSGQGQERGSGRAVLSSEQLGQQRKQRPASDVRASQEKARCQWGQRRPAGWRLTRQWKEEVVVRLRTSEAEGQAV